MIENERALDEIEECLAELSDLDWQLRIWVRGEGDAVSSYVEAVCRLYDDSTLADRLERDGEVAVAPAADVTLRALAALVDEFGGDRSDADRLADPRWPEVVRLAAEARAAVILARAGRTRGS